jgi:hypothetical protein
MISLIFGFSFPIKKNKETIKKGKITIAPMRQSNCHARRANLDILSIVTLFKRFAKGATRERRESLRTKSMTAQEIANIDHRVVNGLFVFSEFGS